MTADGGGDAVDRTEREEAGKGNATTTRRQRKKKKRVIFGVLR